MVSELDREAVLQQVLGTARELTDARYAALGVLNEARTGLRDFITSGIDAALLGGTLEVTSGGGGTTIEVSVPARLAA